MKEIYKDFELEEATPNFAQWSTNELFNHLIDLQQLPYEEEFDKWRWLRNDLIRMCQETIHYEDRRNAR